MAEHLLRWHLDYQTTSQKNKDIKDAYILIKYLLEQIENLSLQIEILKETKQDKYVEKFDECHTPGYTYGDKIFLSDKKS